MRGVHRPEDGECPALQSPGSSPSRRTAPGPRHGGGRSPDPRHGGCQHHQFHRLEWHPPHGGGFGGPGHPDEDCTHPCAHPLLHHHHHRVHWEPIGGVCGHAQQDHDEHNQHAHPKPCCKYLTDNLLPPSCWNLCTITSITLKVIQCSKCLSSCLAEQSKEWTYFESFKFCESCQLIFKHGTQPNYKYCCFLDRFDHKTSRD